MTSLLVTNDFPPKVGGIQSYLWELWRRLPPDDTTVLTTPHPDAARFDRDVPFRIERVSSKVLWPTRAIARRVDALAREVGADVIFLDPMLPLGLIGPRLRSAPYVVIAHGAEITLPGRLPGSHALGRRVLRHAAGVVAAGEYAAAACARTAGRALPTLVIPPGVDPERFQPIDATARAEVRARYRIDVDRPLILGLSRLVPRKGFDVLIRAVAQLDDSVQLAIAGAGRDENRLKDLAVSHQVHPRVRFLERLPAAEIAPLYAAADVFAMLCRDRWGGLEAEGFGIVFVEAAACGVPSIAGRSGGSHEAVVDGETGFVVEPQDVDGVRAALERLLGDDALRARFGAAARERARTELSYEVLTQRLLPVTRGDLGSLRTGPR
ncbi:MAG TPA: glycosyltransferase family 4 protein [Acidimicrobiia bacterium]|nr:glycosyltransferase family 4 protein [Acidimicrobiia bacterium]